MPDFSAVFLSYHSPDRADIIAVQQILQHYGIDTFLDRDNLPLGLSWFEGLQDALGRARAVVVLLGPGELGVWQKREIALALDRQANLERTSTKLLIIPVLLPKAQPEQAPAFLMLNNGLMLTRPITEDTQAMARLVQALGASTSNVAAPLTRLALCPYRGLDAFREEDAALFFGRDSFIENLLDRILHHPVVAVVGASGSGKSSVVQAGLLPRLRRQGGTAPTWDALVCTPGTQPFHRLATALIPLLEPAASVTDRLVAAGRLGDYLATGGYLAAAITQAAETQQVDRLLLVVDQFEELFTQTPSDQRTTFITTLLQATRDSQLRLVFTLRADFYGAVLGANRDLSDCFEKAQVALGPARPAELRQMIEEPALKAGLTFEPGLVPRILDDLTSQPGNLPLLEYALKGLWLARQDSQLTHAGYEAIGGVVGAISQQAETIFQSLSSVQQAAGWRLFSRLVRVAAASEEGTDTRRRVPLDHLDAEAQQVAHRFAAPDVRLLVFAREQNSEDTTVEVAHEALIRTWARLQERLQEERSFLLWRQDLERDVAEWRQLQSEQAVLYAGSKLEKALQLTKGRTADLLPAEQSFLQQSQLRAGKTVRLLKAATGVLFLLVVLISGGWVWLHWTTRGQIALINYELGKLATTTNAPKVMQWARARYLLTGDIEQAVASLEAVSIDNTITLWDYVLQDSAAQRQGLPTTHQIDLLYQRVAQFYSQPETQLRLLQIVAKAYGRLSISGASAEQGLQRMLTDVKAAKSSPVLDPSTVGFIADAYGELLNRGLVADSSLAYLLAETRPFQQIRPSILAAVATAYGDLVNKEALTGKGLKYVLAEARVFRDTSPKDYYFILRSVAVAYSELANQGTVADDGLQYMLAEAKPLFVSDPTSYTKILRSIAEAYGKLARSGVVADKGLQRLVADSRSFLKTRPSLYAKILAYTAAAYGKLVNKGVLTDEDLQQILTEAKPLLTSDTDTYTSILSSIATTYGELTNQGAVADAGLQRVLAEAKPLVKSGSSNYAQILASIAASYGKLASKGTMTEEGLRRILAAAKSLLKPTAGDAENFEYTSLIGNVASAYGNLASAGKEAIADEGLRYLATDAKPLLESSGAETYVEILSSITNAYGKFTSGGALADKGLQHALAIARSLESVRPASGELLSSIADAYGELANAGNSALASEGFRHVLHEARPLLSSDPSGYAVVLESILKPYIEDAYDIKDDDLQQIGEAITRLLSQTDREQDLQLLYAQLLAKKHLFAQAYYALDKMPPDGHAHGLYLILERYYRPASKPSAVLIEEEK